ncbi:NAD(P)-dependent oxidoreductase [Cereibacter changlensis]|uniref:NAD(P)-dependent oxidoreductase n=1 Tax=Cereibacter changlensis TaxID=402884 RepID=A0A4U0YQ85_9RHOB|nr:NAD(P)-dependent oxidoreductase [Cereibacter changlensis]TKA94620.1 NAD(P)-dependent oxidoreductase [Cereibacter changlensis]
MRIAITGATGFVGRFLTEAALRAGHEVTVLGRQPGLFSAPVAHLAYDLRQKPPPLDGHDALIHAAFLHEPGRYRGGEGDDPAGFRAANLDGTLRLFEAAQGCERVLFLSSRAVYGDHPPGTLLTEATPLRPDTLYGELKAEAEAALEALPVASASLRATGVYGPAGPGRAHKWTALFEKFRAGAPIAPRVATEVHGDDLAAAALLLLEAPAESIGGAWNVSDLLLDQRDLLAEVVCVAGGPELPARADAALVNVMDCSRLRSLGWRPGGWDRLRKAIPGLI